MSLFSKLFGSKSSASPRKDDGLDEEHAQLRRAIERCDNLKFAVEAKQMTIAEVADKLLNNDFPKPIVKKAIVECFGDAAKKHVE